MLKWIKRKLTPKTLSQEKLSDLATSKKRKEWEMILDRMAEHAMQLAEAGHTFFVVKHELLANEYNQERTKEQILSDVRKRFPRCDCHFEYTILGQENIMICWKKKFYK